MCALASRCRKDFVSRNALKAQLGSRMRHKGRAPLLVCATTMRALLFDCDGIFQPSCSFAYDGESACASLLYSLRGLLRYIHCCSWQCMICRTTPFVRHEYCAKYPAMQMYCYTGMHCNCSSHNLVRACILPVLVLQVSYWNRKNSTDWHTAQHLIISMSSPRGQEM